MLVELNLQHFLVLVNLLSQCYKIPHSNGSASNVTSTQKIVTNGSEKKENFDKEAKFSDDDDFEMGDIDEI